MTSKELGQRGEETVIHLLKKENFSILEKNYKKFFGEVDIIAERDNIVVFVEVKTRRKSMTSMFEIVTPGKQHKIIKVAKEYIGRQKIENKTYRFDVALVSCNKNNELETTYIPNAFYQREE